MSYRRIEIIGFRGFGTKEKLNFATPNTHEGSGLTVVVGPNNSGKSTIFEALVSISQSNPPSFSSGRRNNKTRNQVSITISNDDGSLELRTETTGGSQTEFHDKGLNKSRVKLFTLPSRRTFPPFFSKNLWTREQYQGTFELPQIRGTQLASFGNRLFTIQKNQKAFNDVLHKVVDHVPSWHIEQSDQGQHYLNFNDNGSNYNSDGIGEGLLSIFTIVDTLYDSVEGDTIVIDEPELSLHPSLQKKVANLLVQYAATRQIIIFTHSPYFINWKALQNGGKIARTSKESDGIKIYELSERTTKEITTIVNDNLNNPHIFGLDAREIFFLDDRIILVEGQEDVIFYSRIFYLKQIETLGSFYGWGVGGAGNMHLLVKMLHELGFKRVAIIFDNNERNLIPSLQKTYPEYYFTHIPTNDVRDKKEKGIEGLIDSTGKIVNPKYDSDIANLGTGIKKYMISEISSQKIPQ